MLEARELLDSAVSELQSFKALYTPVLGGGTDEPSSADSVSSAQWTQEVNSPTYSFPSTSSSSASSNSPSLPLFSPSLQQNANSSLPLTPYSAPANSANGASMHVKMAKHIHEKTLSTSSSSSSSATSAYSAHSTTSSVTNSPPVSPSVKGIFLSQQYGVHTHLNTLANYAMGSQPKSNYESPISPKTIGAIDSLQSVNSAYSPHPASSPSIVSASYGLAHNGSTLLGSPYGQRLLPLARHSIASMNGLGSISTMSPMGSFHGSIGQMTDLRKVATYQASVLEITLQLEKSLATVDDEIEELEGQIQNDKRALNDMTRKNEIQEASDTDEDGDLGKNKRFNTVIIKHKERKEKKYDNDDTEIEWSSEDDTLKPKKRKSKNRKHKSDNSRVVRPSNSLMILRNRTQSVPSSSVPPFSHKPEYPVYDPSSDYRADDYELGPARHHVHSYSANAITYDQYHRRHKHKQKYDTDTETDTETSSNTSESGSSTESGSGSETEINDEDDGEKEEAPGSASFLSNFSVFFKSKLGITEEEAKPKKKSKSRHTRAKKLRKKHLRAKQKKIKRISRTSETSSSSVSDSSETADSFDALSPARCASPTKLKLTLMDGSRTAAIVHEDSISEEDETEGEFYNHPSSMIQSRTFPIRHYRESDSPGSGQGYNFQMVQPSDPTFRPSVGGIPEEMVNTDMSAPMNFEQGFYNNFLYSPCRPASTVASVNSTNFVPQPFPPASLEEPEQRVMSTSTAHGRSLHDTPIPLIPPAQPSFSAPGSFHRGHYRTRSASPMRTQQYSQPSNHTRSQSNSHVQQDTTVSLKFVPFSNSHRHRSSHSRTQSCSSTPGRSYQSPFMGPHNTRSGTLTPTPRQESFYDNARYQDQLQDVAAGRLKYDNRGSIFNPILSSPGVHHEPDLNFVPILEESVVPSIDQCLSTLVPTPSKVEYSHKIPASPVISVPPSYISSPGASPSRIRSINDAHGARHQSLSQHNEHHPHQHQHHGGFNPFMVSPGNKGDTIGGSHNQTRQHGRQALPLKLYDQFVNKQQNEIQKEDKEVAVGEAGEKNGIRMGLGLGEIPVLHP